MWIKSNKRKIALISSVMMLWVSLFAGVAQAGVISTHDVLAEQQLSYDRSELLSLLDSSDVQEKLTAMGVDQDALAERISVMTPDELAQVNEHIDALPAGAGAGSVLGVLLVIFIVFVITDVIGATNIFPFINPVN